MFKGFMHYPYIATFDTGQDYAAYFKKISGHHDEHLLAHTWLLARAVDLKIKSMGQAIRWTTISLVLLALLIVFRFSISFTT
jgi:hypothetical protein